MERKVVSSLPEIQVNHEGICKGCAQGKNAKKTFPSNESKAKGIPEIVHLDVCGPMSSSSLRGHVYYVSFIYDFSHKTWIYFLKEKNEVFSNFKEFKSLVEITMKGISRLCGQIMAKNSPQKNSRNSVENLGLRGS